MSVFGLMVTRNEADRYLAASVAWLGGLTDAVIVFDDLSTDATVEVAEAAGAYVARRTETHPSFLENESQFRQAAWAALQHYFDPTPADWVLSVDADEFVVSNTKPASAAVLAAIDYGDAEGAESIDLPVAEVFDMVGPRPMVRTDGQWAYIRATRLCRWQHRTVFADVQLAGGSLPKIASPALRLGDPVILHAGYRRLEDRHAKHARYREHAGHSQAHVDSILKPGIYEPWSTPIPQQIAEALS